MSTLRVLTVMSAVGLFHLIIFVAAFVAASCKPATSQSKEHPNVGAMVTRTVKLNGPGCSAVRIGGGRVVTAKHCVGSKRIGDVYSDLVLEYLSPSYDFVILKGDVRLTKVVMSDAIIGEHVYAVGFPGSIDDGKGHLTVTDGVFTGVEDGYMQRITAFGYYGNSGGGGVWNNRGELVGILVEIRPTDATYDGYTAPFPASTYMVPVKYIRETIKEINANVTKPIVVEAAPTSL